jgi:hypothetical protein
MAGLAYTIPFLPYVNVRLTSLSPSRARANGDPDSSPSPTFASGTTFSRWSEKVTPRTADKAFKSAGYHESPAPRRSRPLVELRESSAQPSTLR